MEMESSRRPSLDRSRELGVKRPRLAEEPNLNNRPFQQKQQRPTNSGGAAVSAASARFRVNNDRDRDSDESVRGGGPYQQASQLLQHQELISQYKAALAELTFNSKPIITNLTIIAGENTHAAKAIAATICTNIIEVPSDQKLPSLYLLDSIVKNIGRDYIKYFAGKLPEVFCKAYRQVDSSTHSSMQHLFGTWKGVFPAQSLQIIERELGFLAAANGSSSASTSSRSDSQTQRQPHSIHVNPKYLEARQRLQQPSRNVQHPQREELRDAGHEKPLGAESEDHEYGSGLSRHITSRLGKPNERIMDHSYDKQWSSAGRGVEDSISSQRNGVNARQSAPSHMASRSANVHLLPTQSVASRGSRELPRSWKNSEEEEFMWDDLNPGGADNVAIDNIQKDHWTVDGLDKLEFGGRNTNRLNQADVGLRIDRETDSEQVPFGRQRSSSWQMQEQLHVQGSDIPPPRTGFQSHVGPAHTGASSFGLPTIAASVPAGSLVQRLGSSGKPLISQPSSRDPRLNFAEKEQAQANSVAPPIRKPALLSRSLDTGTHNPKLVGVHHNLHLDNFRKSEPQKKPSSVPSSRVKQYNPPAQQLPLGQSDAEPSSGFQLGSPSGTLNHVAGESVGQLNTTSALLAAILKSGVPPGSLTDGAQPSLSAGPSQTSLAGSVYKSSSSSGSPLDLLSLLSQRKTDEPPQSSAPPPASSLIGTVTPSSNPFSSLLNTLVAKGLISAAKTEPESPASPLLSSKSNNKSPSIAATTSAEVPSVSVSSAIPSSTTDKLTSSKATRAAPPQMSKTEIKDRIAAPPQKSKTEIKDRIAAPQMSKTEIKDHIAAPQMSKTEIKDLIGFEFRPDILRQFHSSVVDGLFEDLPHQCSICGLRLKLKERLDRHLEWHALKQSDLDKSPGMWYANSDNWVAGKAAVNHESSIVIFSQESSKASEEDLEPMVPADESQCVCLLCGELFEDFYSLQRDEWMFKGAVYMKSSSESGAGESSSQTTGQGVIVHAKCMADDSVRDLDLSSFVKLEKDV